MSEKIIYGENVRADNSSSAKEKISLALAMGFTFAAIVAILHEPVVLIISG